MMDKTNPMDWVFFLLMFQAVGLKGVIFSDFGVDYANVRYKLRMLILVAGMCLIWIPYTVVWQTYGFSPIELWNTAPEWSAPEYGFFGKVVTFGALWMAISPLHALYAFWRINRAHKLGKRYRAIIRPLYIPSPRTPS